MTRKAAIQLVLGLVAGIPGALYGQTWLFELNFGKRKPKPKPKAEEFIDGPTSFLVGSGPGGYEPGTAFAVIHLDAFDHIEVQNGPNTITISRHELWEALSK